VPLTPAELTILGLIIEQPRHGYELERVIEQRGIRDWTELGFSSIYYVLGRLERRELVTAEPAPGPKSRRVFRATPAGLSAAREATLAMLTDARPVFSPFPAALAQRPLVGEADFAAALRQRRDALTARIAAVEAARAAQQPLPPPAAAIFGYTLGQMAAEIAWLDTTLDDSEESS
jgi:DNA-binding PadR family transcriptional regulator